MLIRPICQGSKVLIKYIYIKIIIERTRAGWRLVSLAQISAVCRQHCLWMRGATRWILLIFNGLADVWLPEMAQTQTGLQRHAKKAWASRHIAKRVTRRLVCGLHLASAYQKTQDKHFQMGNDELLVVLWLQWWLQPAAIQADLMFIASIRIPKWPIQKLHANSGFCVMLFLIWFSLASADTQAINLAKFYTTSKQSDCSMKWKASVTQS